VATQNSKSDFSLFPETKEYAKNYLNLVYNDKRVFNYPLEFFDTNKFNSLKLVTFVSSPKFFFENIKGFQKVIAILGEEETAKTFSTFDVNKEEEYIKEAEQISPELVKSIIDGNIELRYLGLNKRIHSKIYILHSPDESFYRIAFGSANFTTTAFGNNKQYEELVIYDSDYNPDICKIYTERFSEIYKNSYNFLSDVIKNKAKKNIIQNVIQTENVFYITDDEKAKAILEKVNKENIYNADADDIVVISSQKKDAVEKELVLIEKEEKILDILTIKNKDKTVFKPQSKLKNIEEKIKEIIVLSNKKSKNLLDTRKSLIYDKSVLYVKENNNDEIAVPFAAKTTQDELQKRLIQITNFVDSYYKFAVNPDKDILKNAFESILFAFTSPLIHVIRKSIKDEKEMEKVAEMPIILILGGHSGAGKTKLLRFINGLLGNDFDVFDYAQDIDSRNKIVLYDLFKSNNVFPVLVDEISNNFYKGKGEELIKSLTNNLVEPHPCLIGTSNTEFGAEHQVIRRIYYLNFTSPIDTNTRKNEIDKYFEETVGNPDDVLFRHFLAEFIERMHNGETFYTLEDPLYLSRIIFRDMFKSVQLPIPNFISDKPRGDYYKTGSIRWNALYSTQPAYFKKMKDSGENYLVIDLDSIYDTKESKSLQNCIPPSVIKSNGSPLILFEDRFLEFIGKDIRWGKIKRFFGVR